MTRRISRRTALRGAGLGVAGLAGAALIGCGDDDEEDEEEEAAAQAPAPAGTAAPAAPAAPAALEPIRGGRLLTRGGSVPNIDIHLSAAGSTEGLASHMYARLWKATAGADTGGPWDHTQEPDLAMSLEQPDNVTYLYQLRRDAKWQNLPPVNGRPFTGEDIVFSFQRILDEPTAPVRGDFQRIKTMTLIDDYTLELVLSRPNAPFHAKTSGRGAYIVPREVVEQDGDLTKRWVGLGPFILEEFDPRVASLFRRNPDYYDAPKPYIDEVEIAVITDAAAREAAFFSGRLAFGRVNSKAEFDRYESQVSGVQSWFSERGGRSMFFRSGQAPLRRRAGSPGVPAHD